MRLGPQPLLHALLLLPGGGGSVEAGGGLGRRGAWLEGDGGEGGLGLGRRGGSNQRLSLFSAGSGHSQTCSSFKL